MRRLIKRQIEDPLTEMILDNELGAGARVHVRVHRGEYAFSFSAADEPALQTV